MDRYKKIHRFADALGIGVGVVFSKYANEWLTSQEISNPLVIAALLAIVTITHKTIRLSFDLLFENCFSIRRFLLGKMFVEGTWLELVRGGNDSILTAITYFRSSGQSLSFGGVNQKADGKTANTFRAEMVRIVWPTFQYKYINQPTEGSSQGQEGYSEIHFVERDGPPKHYSGFFIHFGEGLRYNIMAEKVEDPETLRKLDNMATRQEVLSNFISSMINNE